MSDAVCAESKNICRIRCRFQYQQSTLCGEFAVSLPGIVGNRDCGGDQNPPWLCINSNTKRQTVQVNAKAALLSVLPKHLRAPKEESIEERLAVVERREELFHWKMNSVLLAKEGGSKKRFPTMAERTSRADLKFLMSDGY